MPRCLNALLNALFVLTGHTHLAGARTPQVDTCTQSNAEHIQRGPVHEVEVEVVLELWSIQDFERYFGYFARRFPWRPQQLLAAMHNTSTWGIHATVSKTAEMTWTQYYLLLLTGDREYGETVFPSSSGRALLALIEYYETKSDGYWFRKKVPMKLVH